MSTSKTRTKVEKHKDMSPIADTTSEPLPLALADDSSTAPETPAHESKKRKRAAAPVEEIEVNVAAPEPPSKKALRKAKKGKSGSTTAPEANKYTSEAEDSEAEPGKATEDEDKTAKRSPYGIWIGNLAYATAKTDLRGFLTNNSTITDDRITRIHLPGPNEKEHGSASTVIRQRGKPQNKGFAYIDLSTAEDLTQALALSEKLLGGRKVLIKDSKSFEGRPEKPRQTDEGATSRSTKPSSKRIFVGNLGFDVTQDDLQEHFSPCGEVDDIHMATFEDTGKCKGFAWVTFQDVEAAMAAVRGWVKLVEKPGDESSDGSESESSEVSDDEEGGKRARKPKQSKVKPKTRKWWVNRIKGRSLRMEFAEDKAVRYKKRFGKDRDGGGKRQHQGGGRGDATPSEQQDGNEPEKGIPSPSEAVVEDTPAPTSQKPRRQPRKDRSVDARTIKPGAALANASRSTGAIVEGKGKKTVFN